MPDFDEIERAYTRPRPPPPPGLDGFKRLVTGGTNWIAAGFFVLVIFFAISAAADQVLRLGLGFHWRDFWAALGMGGFGAVIYGISRAWFAFIGFDRLSSDERGRRRKSGG